MNPRRDPTPALVDRILALVRSGATRPETCSALGISTGLFDRWVQRLPNFSDRLALARHGFATEREMGRRESVRQAIEHLTEAE